MWLLLASDYQIAVLNHDGYSEQWMDCHDTRVYELMIYVQAMVKKYILQLFASLASLLPLSQVLYYYLETLKKAFARVLVQSSCLHEH